LIELNLVFQSLDIVVIFLLINSIYDF